MTDNRTQVETREDMEQNIKLQETIELLLAAGYFRARIKGLTAFDKIVGGMIWCITTCNFDVDVDLLFQENFSIGQKIALTEKIVAALPEINCPHSIEPHQIQGLDFIHIYPVVQWLVKRAIEIREELGDSIRSYSIWQFSKHYSPPDDMAADASKSKSSSAISSLRDAYRPQRRYRRHDFTKHEDEETRVHLTILEYGRLYGFRQCTKDGKEMQSHPKMLENSSLFLKDAKADVGRSHDEEEEKKIQELIDGMTVTGLQEAKLTPRAVSSIVGMQLHQIQEMASEYTAKQTEIQEVADGGRLSEIHHHKRLIASLERQVQDTKLKLSQNNEKIAVEKKRFIEAQTQLDEAKQRSSHVDRQLAELDTIESGKNESVLSKLQSLLALNENLKRQEEEYKAQCKKEMACLQNNIMQLEQEAIIKDANEKGKSDSFRHQYVAENNKLQHTRLILARRNREVAALMRRIDETPSRAELSQYQRRFVELYNQVSSTHSETKQFYALYNTLDDTKLYLNKEVNILNSIYDTFLEAMSSQSNKEQFLQQLEKIVEGVNSNRLKVEQRRRDEKVRRDQLNYSYLDMVEQQRLYFKTIKEFKEECRRNETLLSKLKSLQ